MSAAPLETVRALLTGAPAAGEALLPASRAHAFGADAFGPDAIAELFARHPAPLSPDPHVIETASSLAVFDASPEGVARGVVADLYDGRIGRLWRVGPAVEPDSCAEPSLAVGFDPFLSQVRRASPVDASDHPELEGAAIAALAHEVEVQSLAAGVHRGQVLPVRAFGRGGRAAALLSVQSNTGARLREASQRLAVVVFRFDAQGATLHRLVAEDTAPTSPTLLRLVPNG